MKYVCFGYLDAEQWGRLSPEEQQAMIDRCFTYDETLKRNGNWVYGDGLQGPDSTVSLQYQKGKVAVTDGPYAETKEILGGLLIIEALDSNHAVQLISNHPGLRMGRWEIRPALDLTPMIQESERRRGIVR
ncbi:DGPFAETKE family protein [Nitrospira japonica]|uniref:DGPFAETKE family protein n=1 Tax=Nitrospira japonica TaxID=1325564 RepID=A0A1W1IA13_9BACT|nr:YciI family protein [Nitrospira japonica]SLM49840.1 DGPFAETKE family protein [Nitrospira japonica]